MGRVIWNYHLFIWKALKTWRSQIISLWTFTMLYEEKISPHDRISKVLKPSIICRQRLIKCWLRTLQSGLLKVWKVYIYNCIVTFHHYFLNFGWKLVCKVGPISQFPYLSHFLTKLQMVFIACGQQFLKMLNDFALYPLN